MDPSGGGKTKLTANDGPSENEPHWSPDGARIAFLSDAEEREGNDDLYTMAADGSDVRMLLERHQGRGHRLGSGAVADRPEAPDVEGDVRPHRAILHHGERQARAAAGTAGGCAGRVQVTVERAKRVARPIVRLDKRCRFRAVLRFSAPAAAWW